ncbi:MAG: hypothetical protein IPM64_05525 [Phycisphaerales bacterium]|nr:hypothetical protein [Phycisphaerales bacterium]
MTMTESVPLPLGSLVALLNGPYLGQQGLIVDRREVPAEVAGATAADWEYVLWVDEPGEELAVRHGQVCEISA